MIHAVFGDVEVACLQHTRFEFHHAVALVDGPEFPVLRVRDLLDRDVRRFALEFDGNGFTGSGGPRLAFRVHEVAVSIAVLIDRSGRQCCTKEQRERGAAANYPGHALSMAAFAAVRCCSISSSE